MSNKVAAAQQAFDGTQAELDLAKRRLAERASLSAIHLHETLQWAEAVRVRRTAASQALDRETVASERAVPVEIWGGFGDPRWETWTPPERPRAVMIPASDTHPESTGLRVGSIEASNGRAVGQVRFIGSVCSFLVRNSAATDRAAHLLLQALVLRIATQLPRQVRFTLIDPVGYGRSFPMARSLPNVREAGDDVGADVRAILQDVRRLTMDVIGFHERLDRLSAEIQASERYEGIFVADFPKARAFDRRCTDLTLRFDGDAARTSIRTAETQCAEAKNLLAGL